MEEGTTLAWAAWPLNRLIGRACVEPARCRRFVVHGFPAWTVYPVMLRRLGGAALVAGCYTRVTAIALLPVLLGALTVHWPNGWCFGNPHGGWEYIAVLLAALLVHAGLRDRCPCRSCPDVAR